MCYGGRVRNGIVVLDDDVSLPEGIEVRVEPVHASDRDPVHSTEYVRRMLAIAGTAKGLPSDLAQNHDHYLHGHPKR